MGQKLNKKKKSGKVKRLGIRKPYYPLLKLEYFSGGTIKSYSKRKLSTDDKINDVDLDDDGLSESKTTVTIQLDPHQQNNPQLFQVKMTQIN